MKKTLHTANDIVTIAAFAYCTVLAVRGFASIAKDVKVHNARKRAANAE